MKNIKKQFSKIASWLWSPVFYQNLDGRPIGPAIRRLVAFVFAGTFIVSLWMAFFIVPKVIDFSRQIEEYVYAEYPADLVLTIENGIAKTEIDRRYEFKAIDFFSRFDDRITLTEIQKIGIENILLIDTVKESWSLSDWRDSQSAIILTRDSIVRFNGRGFEVDTLSNFKSKISLDRDQAIILSSKFIQISKIILPFIGLFFFFLFFVGKVVFYLLTALLAGLIIFLSSRIGRQTKKDFRSSFEISLYAICLPAFLLIIFPVSIGTRLLLAILMVLLIWLFNSRAEANTAVVVKDDKHNKPMISGGN